MVTSVVFDVGETLLDDSREWGAWADWLEVPRHTFSAVLGAVTADGGDNARVFEYFRPGFDLARERQARETAGHGERIEDGDLYADARPSLEALRQAGLWVGIAGNQTARAADLLRALDLPADYLGTSGEWGVAKPQPAFFQQVIKVAPGDPGDIVYVGDHRDNDLLPAKSAGLRVALIRRGPWGYLWSNDSDVRANADWVIDSLAELPDLLLAS